MATERMREHLETNLEEVPIEDCADELASKPADKAAIPLGVYADDPKSQGRVTLEDFYAVMPDHRYIYVPTRETWPGSSINSRLPWIGTGKFRRAGKDEEPKEIMQSPGSWLDKNRPVDQLTWAPGMPMLIQGKLVSDGGWIKREGSDCFNLYRPPVIKSGDATQADPWLKHLRTVYPDEHAHMERWLAHRVQHPGEKINHALVLGGSQGIGKDTILDPVKHAVGPWNFSEIGPQQLLGRFNGFVKSVILRINEARDLGDVNRYAFYDRSKSYITSPPDVTRCDEKNLREHAVMNVCGVIITTNHKTDGIYLPADDRRHYVAWSERAKEKFPEDYWRSLYGWYASGGIEHVAAYLASLDLTGWDPKAPPPQTPAWHDIVNANRPPESAELASILEDLSNPAAVTVGMVADHPHAETLDFRLWLRDRRNSRQIPHRFEEAGYMSVRNDGQSDGRWKVAGRNQVIYARRQLCVRDRIVAARRLCDASRPRSP